MPFSYEINRWRRLVIARFHGVTDDEELMGYYERLRHDPSFDPRYWELVDLRDVDRFETAGVTIEAVARLRVFHANVRRAAIAPTDLAFGLARIFAAYAECHGQEVEVFRDASDADEWLAR